jgi:hypothetical protein
MRSCLVVRPSCRALAGGRVRAAANCAPFDTTGRGGVFFGLADRDGGLPRDGALALALSLLGAVLSRF